VAAAHAMSAWALEKRILGFFYALFFRDPVFDNYDFLEERG